jgi:RNA polymerase sigma-70 factor (ECF subfamily)
VARPVNSLRTTEEADQPGAVPGGHLRPMSLAAKAEDRDRVKAALLGSFDLVWRMLRGLGVDPSAVDDAAQQVFLVFSRRLNDVPPGKERAFLVQTAIRVASNCRRGQRRRRELPGGTLDDHGGTAPDPERLLQQKQRCELMEQLLDTVPDSLRVVFVLFELEGMTSSEIASLLGIPRGTVVSRLRRARETFSAAIAAMRARYPDGERP